MRVKNKISLRNASICLIILCSLGFPGNYSLLFGSWMSTIIEYGCFALEIYFVFIEGKNNLLHLQKSSIPIVLFPILIFGMSMLVTNYIGLEIISCIRFMLTVFFALWLANRFDVKYVIELVCKTQAVFVVMTLFYCLISPTNAFESTTLVLDALAGLFSSKNNCGFELSFGIVAYTLLIKINREIGKKTKLSVYVLSIIQCIMLIETQATGALLVTIIAVAFIFFAAQKRYNMAVLFVLINAAFFVVSLVLLPNLYTLLSILGKDVTLTGRTTLWNAIIEFMTSDAGIHFWTGYGFCMFWRDPSAYSQIHAMFANQYSFLANMTAGAHNCVMDLWLNIGTVGLVALVYIMYSSLKKYKSMSYAQYLFVSAEILFFTMHGLTERVIETYNYSTFFLFIALAYAIKKEENKTEEGNRYEILGRTL